MSDNAGAMLRTARKTAGMSQTQVYLATRISESNLARWESGESKPNMEDLYKLELLYHSPGLWSRYLRASSPAYAAHHPTAEAVQGKLAQVVRAGMQAGDMQSMQVKVQRDLLDGEIDDAQSWQEYMQQVRAVHMATEVLMEEDSIG